eukprot:763916-Hanusia_phi.AAC.4
MWLAELSSKKSPFQRLFCSKFITTAAAVSKDLCRDGPGIVVGLLPEPGEVHIDEGTVSVNQDLLILLPPIIRSDSRSPFPTLTVLVSSSCVGGIPSDDATLLLCIGDLAANSL